ncbi:hypothetical protein N9457_03410 [Flavobacteriaceae bacterium]|nr:hypothetical protein [Flavobacteriaceae bacterium]|tara:strand:- start:741 stop:1328 length:588 start_codon:yes stop_codon:yes gene_type:complete
MKKIILLFAVFFFTFNSYSQDSNFYLGVGAGMSTMGGDINEGDAYSGLGLNINFLNMGVRFNKIWGLTANLGSSGYALKDGDGAFGAGVLSVGPMISFSAGKSIWDFKPQIILGFSGVWTNTNTLFDDATMKGKGFVIGNSIVLGKSIRKDFSLSIDIDYVLGKYDDISDWSGSFNLQDRTFNSLKLGVGVRYNF